MFSGESKGNIGKKRVKKVRAFIAFLGILHIGIRNIGIYVLILKGTKNKEVKCVFKSQR